MREYVTIGTPEQVAEFRERWIDRGDGAGRRARPASYRVDTASDPFFGRVGAVKAISQLEQSLKFELLVPLRGGRQADGLHELQLSPDHFGTTWDI